MKLTNSRSVSAPIPDNTPKLPDHFYDLDHDTSGALRTLSENFSDTAGAPTQLSCPLTTLIYKCAKRFEVNNTKMTKLTTNFKSLGMWERVVWSF